MMKNKEIRAFNFEVRAAQNEEHGHFLEGMPIVFDQRTDLGYCDEITGSGRTRPRRGTSLAKRKFDFLIFAPQRFKIAKGRHVKLCLPF